eukprot:FR738384.1.p1 GENE.FR738384.1~~FR738384.1.p1  ORF type:complete len:190 (-),score=28.73 FR738384.1:222-791(-)
MLRAVYKYYSDQGSTRGMDLESFLEMMDDTDMMVTDLWDLSERECRMAYFYANMVVVDELKSHAKLITITFIEFMEALAWIADNLAVPTDDELLKLNIQTDDSKAPFMIDFEISVLALEDNVKAKLLKRRPSAVFLGDKTRSLANKLDKFLQLLGGRLGVRHAGRLPPRGFKFVESGYIFIAQLDSFGK